MATITKVEIKTTSNGKPYKSATLDSQVLGKDRFNIFGFHTRYEDVVEGRAFAVEEFQQDGQYIKLRDPDEGIKGRGGGSKKGFDATAAVALKQAGIAKSQDRNEHSYKVSGTARDATLITVELMKRPEYEGKKFTDTWTMVRQWLWDNYDVDKSDQAPY